MKDKPEDMLYLHPNALQLLVSILPGCGTRTKLVQGGNTWYMRTVNIICSAPAVSLHILVPVATHYLLKYS